MTNRKVSIITVVYNNAKTIEQTIQSVLNQTYPNVEYIIVDGGSTDGTVEIIRKYLDGMAVFISEKDDGLYDAMNKGIEYASGEIVGILNSDDIYVEDAVSYVVESFRVQQADVIYGNALHFDDTPKTSLYNCSDLEEIWYRMAIPHPATFVKREIYIKYGMFDTQYQIAADYDLMLRLYTQGVKFYHLDKILTCFRRGGLNKLKANITVEETWKISNKYIQYCDNKDVYFPIIQEHYAKNKFAQMCKSNDKAVVDEFERIIETSAQNKFVIFGTGIWAERFFLILSESGAHVEFFADNDSEKWGQTFHNITIIPPKQLINYSGHVLIGTFNYEQEIYSQLNELDSSLNIVLLSDLAQKIF